MKRFCVICIIIFAILTKLRICWAHKYLIFITCSNVKMWDYTDDFSCSLSVLNEWVEIKVGEVILS